MNWIKNQVKVYFVFYLEKLFIWHSQKFFKLNREAEPFWNSRVKSAFMAIESAVRSVYRVSAHRLLSLLRAAEPFTTNANVPDTSQPAYKRVPQRERLTKGKMGTGIRRVSSLPLSYGHGHPMDTVILWTWPSYRHGHPINIVILCQEHPMNMAILWTGASLDTVILWT